MKYRKVPPSSTINRLARYLNYLTLLPPEQKRVNSRAISTALGIKSSQFRQDFHYFGGFGRPGRGYDKETLINVLEDILGVKKVTNVIIVGVGHLGTALVNYRYFERLNMKLVGLFDNNHKLVGLSLRGIKIRPPDDLPQFVESQAVDIGIITTSPESAQQIGNLLVSAGIRGIWNFTPIQLEVPPPCVVRNEQPALGLLALTFQLNELEQSNQLSVRKTFSLD